MDISTESYEDIYKNYLSSLAWMGKIGVRLGAGRTGHYERVLKHWKNAYKIATNDEARKAFPDFVSSVFEIFEFVRVWQAFREVPEDQLTGIAEKLQKAVNGPLNAVDETPESTTARNFLFEAVVAAKAHRPKSGIEAILDASSDTGVRFSGKRIWVECKRVTSVDGLERNCKKASKQLERKLGAIVGAGNRGIVALDVSKVLNKGDQILEARSDQELNDTVVALMDHFIERNSGIWQRVYTKRHRKIMGTLVRFAFMAASEERNLLVSVAQWAVNPRLNVRDADRKLQYEIADVLGSIS